MKRYALVMGGLAALLLLVFGLVEWLHVPALVDPSPWLARATPLTAAIGVGLLVADVLVPVPATIVMTALGARFGLVAGAGLALVGATGAAAFGFGLGRRGSKVLGRLVPANERARADKLLARYGWLAVALTRSIPILAETVAIAAGTSTMRWRVLLLASVAGALPPAILLTMAGAWLASGS